MTRADALALLRPETPCERCDEPATTVWDRGEDYQFWTRQPRYEPVCAECHRYYDNREPPDTDGEAFRGTEAAAFQAEQLEAARRLK